MDHARHLASPSPTSSFLFHHSERPFKSSLLTPSLLSSASDVNQVDDCFSLTNSASNQTNLQDRLQDSFGDTDDRNHILVNHDDDDDNNHDVTNVSQAIGQDHQSHCVISHDSLNGVGNDDDDDDNGMHNMLSGSSTSSTTTIPLLTDNHSHHPFSRISLSEYSPLSLVDDCDNALTISPTSLVCGSHHSFKSSLNNLKLENLDGVDVHVDDVVGDARSMSPSLLSANTSSNQNQLWSISSTAITQNPALLSNSSTSFLLSHHHHQLSSLMQQLEPQSLDESPPLINHSLMLETDHMSQLHHRPSSEPPPVSELLANASSSFVDPKSNAAKPPNGPTTSKSKAQSSKSKTTATGSVNLPLNTTTSRSRKNRNRTSKAKPAPNKTNNQDQDKKAKARVLATAEESSYSSKAHLHLNHSKKLLELQQRLFGTVPATPATEVNPSEPTVESANIAPEVKVEVSETNKEEIVPITQTLDTTTEANNDPATNSTDQTSSAKSGTSAKVSESTIAKKSPPNQKAAAKPKTRPTPKRKPKAKNEPISLNSTAIEASPNLFQRSVTTESVEPDTTTKSSDCIKLADLLSTTSSVDSSTANPTIILSNNTAHRDFNNMCDQNGTGDGKRIQHIQLQVSPSLKLMTNGGLVQSMSMQQQIANNLAVVSSGCATFNNQVICRPVNVMTSMNGSNTMSSEEQIKCNIMPGNDWLKSTDSIMLNGNGNTIQTNSVIAANTLGNNHTLGAHQIAIQVICQDGTSIVLPVSASSGLSAALSSASSQQQQQQQQQQLQAVLTNNSKNNANQQRNQSQILPLISVSNILAQQQSTSSSNNVDSAVSNPDNQSSQITNNSTQTTGLAASSPTLAALLDAGSSRGNVNDPNVALSHSIASSNLLRKFVNSNAELKRGKFNLQPGTQIGLTNNGSLVTICAANNGQITTGLAVNNNTRLNHNTQCIGDKRIKLENVREVGGNIQTTFTLIEPQGLIVANGNDAKLLHTENKQTDLQQAKTSLGLNLLNSDASDSMSALKQQLNSTPSNLKTGTDNATPNSSKQGKMTSSTGNRQVDPTQPFRCEHCNSTFTRLGNFTRHKKIHSAPTKDGQRFKCDVCSKSFLQRCDLARHLHIHRGTEPHRCNICGKGYIRHSDLVTHQRFHNKEKPFGCPNCHKGFCQRGDLNRHLRSIHLQLKPLLCPCCNRKFAKRDTLLKHLSTHHRGYPIEMLPP